MQLSGQHLLEPTDAQSVVRDLCGIQAQFWSNAVHALHIRTGMPLSDVSDCVKSWTLRGTMHLFHCDDLPLFFHQDRKRTLRPCDTLETDEAVSAERKKQWAERIVSCVSQGICEREMIKQHCFDAGMTEAECQSIFNPWGGTVRALCEAGVLCSKAQEKKAFWLCEPFEPMKKEQAELEMAKRYFVHYGPATIRDAAYFLGVPQRSVRSWLEEIPAERIVCDEREYWYAGERKNINAPSIPQCLFLAGFDPLMMGYEKTESLYLPREYMHGIFSLSGIVAPAILWNGRVIGRWKRKGNTVEVMFFEWKTSGEKNVIEAYASSLWPEMRSFRVIES